MADLDIGAPVTPSEQGGVEPYDLPMEVRIMQSWDRLFREYERIIMASLTRVAERDSSIIVEKQDGILFDSLELTIDGDPVVARETVVLIDLMEESARREDANTQSLLREEIRNNPSLTPNQRQAYLANMDSGTFRDLNAVNFLEDETVALINKKADDVFQRTRTTVASSVANGLSFTETAAAIAAFPEFGGKRSMVIARTETVRAANEGRVTNFQRNNDVVKGYEHSTFFDDRTGELDKVMDGATYGLNRRPTNAKSRAHSETIPLHPGCRCAYVPILKDPGEVNFET